MAILLIIAFIFWLDLNDDVFPKSWV